MEPYEREATMKHFLEKIYLAFMRRKIPHEEKKKFVPIAEPIEMDIGPEISPSEAMPWERN